MPIYEYRCENGHHFDVMQKMTDGPVTECEVCGAPVQRVFHPDRRALQGLRLLQHRLRHRQRKRETDGVRRVGRRQARRQAGGQEVRDSGSKLVLELVASSSTSSTPTAISRLIGPDRQTNRHLRLGRRAATLASHVRTPRRACSPRSRAIWGGSYLLIKYALDGFSAAMIVSARCLLASAGAARRPALDGARRPGAAPTCARGRSGRSILGIDRGHRAVPADHLRRARRPERADRGADLARLAVRRAARAVHRPERVDRPPPGRRACCSGLARRGAGGRRRVGAHARGVPRRAGDDRRGVLLRRSRASSSRAATGSWPRCRPPGSRSRSPA